MAKGAYAIDCDKLGHDAYKPGTTAYGKIVEAFGEGVFVCMCEPVYVWVGYNLYNYEKNTSVLTMMILMLISLVWRSGMFNLCI